MPHGVPSLCAQCTFLSRWERQRRYNEGQKFLVKPCLKLAYFKQKEKRPHGTGLYGRSSICTQRV
nr:MAG TPA: hypothetical protein [Caudoviricetes sp.]DAT48917.1 MAG TPA: hypothetical protein [Caudoviricetes sp.]